MFQAGKSHRCAETSSGLVRVKDMLASRAREANVESEKKLEGHEEPRVVSCYLRFTVL